MQIFFPYLYKDMELLLQCCRAVHQLQTELAMPTYSKMDAYMRDPCCKFKHVCLYPCIWSYSAILKVSLQHTWNVTVHGLTVYSYTLLNTAGSVNYVHSMHVVIHKVLATGTRHSVNDHVMIMSKCYKMCANDVHIHSYST